VTVEGVFEGPANTFRETASWGLVLAQAAVSIPMPKRCTIFLITLWTFVTIPHAWASTTSLAAERALIQWTLDSGGTVSSLEPEQ
jgi:hypothetical protein